MSQVGLSLHPPLPPPPTNPRSEFEAARHRLEIQRPRLDLERPALERRLHQERLERLSTNEGQRWLVLNIECEYALCGLIISCFNASTTHTATLCKSTLKQANRSTIVSISPSIIINGQETIKGRRKETSGLLSLFNKAYALLPQVLNIRPISGCFV